MRFMRDFLRDSKGASAAEFALVLPLAMLFFFGIIDSGRYMWEVNQTEKATQMGARFAVVNDLIPSELATYSFSIDGGLPQGSVVPQGSFSTIVCSGAGKVSCTCKGSGTCLGKKVYQPAFDKIVARMRDHHSGVEAKHVEVEYAWSGLGFAGDPNGPDVVPLVTVRLRDLEFAPATTVLFGANLPLPSASYSLTLEDGKTG